MYFIPQHEQRGSIVVYILLALFLTALLVGGGYYFGSKNKTNQPQASTNSLTKSKQNLKNTEYKIFGNQVSKVINGQESVLFQNVSNVTQVRLGPDGRTIHFKVEKSDFFKKPQELCADLESKIEPLTDDYPSPPPQSAPWDYERIANYGTIDHCNTYYAGGYLKTGDYFVYLKKDSSQAKIYVENLSSGEVKQFILNSDVLSGFDKGYTVDQNTKFYAVDPVEGKDGFSYYYPQQDAFLQNKYLVLAFGRLILDLDLTNSNTIGTFTLDGVVATSFDFISNKSLPFVIIESGWEGPLSFNQLIDVSGSKIKTVKLNDLDMRSGIGLQIKDPLVWEGNSVLFNFADIDWEAGKKLSAEYTNTDQLPINDNAKMEQINAVAEQILKKDFGYIDTKCSLGPGMISGCDGLKKINKYRYSSEQGLVKI
jgi:hypothetical protein